MLMNVLQFKYTIHSDILTNPVDRHSLLGLIKVIGLANFNLTRNFSKVAANIYNYIFLLLKI